MHIETDYLIIGAGAVGLAFADELLTRSDAHLTIVDMRHAPGGHWNDAYPFVRLHQPSVFYGVESTSLSDARIDQSGTNQGLLSLAEGSEITHYFHTLMRERLLTSGRVNYIPLCKVQIDGTIVNLLSGEVHTTTVRKKIVDAAMHTNSVPMTHTRKFEVAAGAQCVPPNHLPRLAPGYRHYTVLGAGKTGIDTCLWLLECGTPAKAITWIVPRDPWLWNRAKTQPAMEFFDEVFGGLADRQEIIANSRSSTEFSRRMESAGIWLRIDESVEPSFFHAATVTRLELDELRRIDNIVRLGRVQSISDTSVMLERGSIDAEPNTLYVDCTASALSPRPTVPVFSGDRITLQMVRFPQQTFSAALIAFLETKFENDAEKNQYSAPISLPDSVTDYIKTLMPDMMNQYLAGKHPAIKEWIGQSRLDAFTRVAREVDKSDEKKMAILGRLREGSKAAVANLPRLMQAE